VGIGRDVITDIGYMRKRRAGRIMGEEKIRERNCRRKNRQQIGAEAGMERKAPELAGRRKKCIVPRNSMPPCQRQFDGGILMVPSPSECF